MKKRQVLMQEMFNTTYEISRIAKKRMSSFLEALHISPAQTHLIFTIMEHQPVTSKQLAKELILTPGAVAQLVDSLARGGYVIRTQDDNDRRIAYLTLSQSGHALAHQFKAYREELLGKFLQSFSDPELEQYTTLQKKFLTSMQNGEEHLK